MILLALQNAELDFQLLKALRQLLSLFLCRIPGLNAFLTVGLSRLLRRVEGFDFPVQRGNFFLSLQKVGGFIPISSAGNGSAGGNNLSFQGHDSEPARRSFGNRHRAVHVVGEDYPAQKVSVDFPIFRVKIDHLRSNAQISGHALRRAR